MYYGDKLISIDPPSSRKKIIQKELVGRLITAKKPTFRRWDLKGVEVNDFYVQRYLERSIEIAFIIVLNDPDLTGVLQLVQCFKDQ